MCTHNSLPPPDPSAGLQYQHVITNTTIFQDHCVTSTMWAAVVQDTHDLHAYLLAYEFHK